MTASRIGRIVITVAAVLALPSFAHAGAAPATEKAAGAYRFCGWSDFDGNWYFGPPESGAFFGVKARNLSCRKARQLSDRVGNSGAPDYRPVLAGFRCRSVATATESSRITCTRKDNRKSFRILTGA